MINTFLCFVVLGSPLAQGQGVPSFGGSSARDDVLAAERRTAWAAIKPMLVRARALWDEGKIGDAALVFDQAILQEPVSSDVATTVESDNILIESLYMQGKYRGVDVVAQRNPMTANQAAVALAECKLGRLSVAAKIIKALNYANCDGLPVPAETSDAVADIEASALLHFAMGPSGHRPDISLRWVMQANRLSPHSALIVSTGADMMLRQRRPAEALKMFNESEELLKKMDPQLAKDRLIKVESGIRASQWLMKHPYPVVRTAPAHPTGGRTVP